MNNIKFNNKNLLNELIKCYIINDITSLTYIHNNKYYKFKKLDYESLDTGKYINSLIISNDFMFSKTNTIITVCKAIRNENMLNFGFIYSNINNNTLIHNTVVLSLSLISKDGEYKHRMINFNIINEIFKIPLINKIYEYLNNNYKNKEFTLDYEIYNLNDKKIKNNYVNQNKNKILLLKLYTIIWITELYMNERNGDLLSIDENFFNILTSPKDIMYFQEIYKQNKDELDNIMPLFTYYNKNNRLQLGQKLLPFNYNQLKDYKHLIHFQWKELLINRIINNLIHNNISICFSLFIDWILISNSDKELYNNAEIFKKILHSDQIKNILQYLHFAKNNLLSLDNKQEKNKLINKLEKKLNNLIELTQSNMLMSTVSLNFFSEYSGKTLFNYLNLTLKNKNNKLFGNILQDYDILCKYLFEIIYSLYCLNLKGIIHGDLHLNNITFNLNNIVENDTYVIYDLNNSFNNDILEYIKHYPNIYSNNLVIDENINDDISNNNSNTSDNTNKIGKLINCFQFKHTGYFPCIIDYGRSFLLLKLIDEDVIEKEKTSVRQKYIKNETKRIINELNKIFPNYIKNNMHKLKFLFKNKNFNILFIYFTAYDTFTFITNLLIFMKKSSLNFNIDINPKIISLLTALSKKSYSYLEQILNEDNYMSEKKHQFPNYLLLNEIFHNFKSNDIKVNYTISHYYSINNINKYYSVNEIKKINKKILTNYINSSNIPNNEKTEIKKRFSSLLFNTNENLSELDVEKVINKEYYNIKSNIHVISSVINNPLDLTYDVTTNSLNISNY